MLCKSSQCTLNSAIWTEAPTSDPWRAEAATEFEDTMQKFNDCLSGHLTLLAAFDDMMTQAIAKNSTLHTFQNES